MVFSSISGKPKLFVEKFSMNSAIDDGGIYLPVFPSRSNIPVVVLKNCEPELSYKLTKLFNMCLKESSIQNCWKVSSLVPVFTNVGERSATKNYCLLSIISVASNVFLPETLK